MCPDVGSSAAEAVSQLPEGTLIGDYRIIRLLGEGGMGFVYEANHEVLNRRAAMKFLRPELTSNSNVVTRFLQEAKAVNVISHDNIIDIYDYGEGAGGAVYFVMEYLEGEDLTDLLDRERPLPIVKTLSIFKQIMRALSAAHAKQIVHRDLKPDNVFLARREDNPHFVKLLDFGIAKLRGQGEVKGLTRQGTLMGTPQFMSPEQAQGMSVDARSDIFSLGVMLYYAVTGTLPFDGADLTTVITKIVQQEPRPPRELVQPGVELPAALETLILRSLAKAPQDRYASIDDMLAALVALETKLGLGTKVEARAPSLPAQAAVAAPARPLPIAKLAAVAALVLAAAAVAIVVMRGDGASEPSSEKPPAAATEPSGPDQPNEAVTMEALVADGKLGEAKALARAALIAELGGDAGAQSNAVFALSTARTDKIVTLLYKGLEGAPQVRLDAARALRDMGIPDAAPKIRDALGASGDKLRVALAACLIELGDDSALPIVEQALAGEPGAQMTAAEAMARARKGDAGKVREVLAARYASTPPGRDLWRRAAHGLIALGDDAARAALSKELALPHAERAVAAATILVAIGDDAAIAYLERVSADPEFSGRGAAALALARTGNKSALDFVSDGLASKSADDRIFAAAVAATLASSGGNEHARTIAALDQDSDRRVRSTARAALLAF